MKNLYNIEETSKFLRISVSTLYRWVHKKEIPFVKLGGKLLFDEDEIEFFVRNNTKKFETK